jgi:hypothetical protein
MNTEEKLKTRLQNRYVDLLESVYITDDEERRGEEKTVPILRMDTTPVALDREYQKKIAQKYRQKTAPTDQLLLGTNIHISAINTISQAHR